MSRKDRSGLNELSLLRARKQKGMLMKWRRWLVVLATGIITALLIPLLFLWLMPSEWISHSLRDLVKAQTGGDLTIEASALGPHDGLSLNGIRFAPPGHERTLVEIDRLQIGWRFVFLYLLQFKVDGAFVENVRVTMHQQKGVWDYQAILDFRDQNFPAPKIPLPVEIEEAEPFRLSRLWPGMLFIPLRIDLKDIGIRNLSIEVFADQQPTFSVAGLSLLAEFYAWGTSNRLGVKISGDPNTGLEWVASEHLSGSFELNSAWELLQLSHLKGSGSFRTSRVVPPTNPLSQARGELQVEIKTHQQFQNIEIVRWDLSMLAASRHQLSGSISFPDDNFDTIRLDLSQSLVVVLDELSSMLQTFLPGAKLAGSMRMTNAQVRGDIRPRAFDPAHEDFILPDVQMAGGLSNLSVLLPQWGFALKPTNADLKVNTQNVLGESQLDFKGSLAVPSLSAKPPTGDQTFQIDDLSATIDGQVSYPKLAIPKMEAKLSWRGLTAEAAGMKVSGVPLEMEVSADASPKLRQLKAGVYVDIQHLVNSRLKLDCSDACLKSKTEFSFSVPQVANVVKLLEPSLKPKIPAQFLPQNVVGRLEGKLFVDADIPSFKITNLQEFVDAAKIDYKAEINTKSLDLEVPFYSLAIRGYSNRLSLDGSLRESRLDFSQALNALAGALPAANAVSTAQTFAVKGMTTKLGLELKTDSGFQLATPLQKFSLKFDAESVLAAIDAQGLLPFSVVRPAFKLKGRLDSLKSLAIQNLSFGLPQLGTKLTMTLHSEFNENKFPSKIRSRLALDIDAAKSSDHIDFLQSSGSFSSHLDVISDDMDLVALSGKLVLDEFDLAVKNASLPEKNLFEVGRASGSMPLTQDIWLSKLPLPESVRAGLGFKTSETSLAKKAAEPVSQDEALDLSSVMDSYFERTADVLSDKQNKIVEVDYQNMRTFFKNRQPIRIKKLAAAGIVISDLLLDMELRQNWFAVNQFAMNILDGKIDGSFQLAFDPLPQVLQTSVHMTRLNSRRLLDAYPELKKNRNDQDFSTQPYIDGTTHLRMDLKNSDMSGGIEFTTIGKEQLRMILFFLDPLEQNPSLGLVRQSLKVGNVNLVRMPIKNGEIGIDVDLSVFGVPLPIPEVRRIPLAKVIDDYKRQVLAGVASKMEK